MEEIQFHARCEFYAMQNWGCIGLQEPGTSNNQRHISNGAGEEIACEAFS
jgi:hypothetical protein